MQWIEQAPREYVVSQPPATIARHTQLLAAWEEVGGRHIAVGFHDREGPVEGWGVDIVAADRHGLLARIASRLSDRAHDVRRAVAVIWPGGPALESFLLSGPIPDDLERLRAELVAAVDAPMTSEGVAGAEVVFDDADSPWYTVCRVTIDDAPGILGAIAAAFAAAGVDVHSAVVETRRGVVADRFEVSRDDGRLDADTRAIVRHNLEHGVELPGRRSLRGRIADRGRDALSSVTRQAPATDTTSPRD